MEDILCNRIQVKRFVNTPVPSNTYLLVDGEHCLVIDPGSKEQADVCNYIQTHGLTLDYIILTHEHFDHCWGVNDLIEKTQTKVVFMQNCKDKVIQPSNYLPANTIVYPRHGEFFCLKEACSFYEDYFGTYLSLLR